VPLIRSHTLIQCTLILAHKLSDSQTLIRAILSYSNSYSHTPILPYSHTDGASFQSHTLRCALSSTRSPTRSALIHSGAPTAAAAARPSAAVAMARTAARVSAEAAGARVVAVVEAEAARARPRAAAARAVTG